MWCPIRILFSKSESVNLPHPNPSEFNEVLCQKRDQNLEIKFPMITKEQRSSISCPLQMWINIMISVHKSYIISPSTIMRILISPIGRGALRMKRRPKFVTEKTPTPPQLQLGKCFSFHLLITHVRITLSNVNNSENAADRFSFFLILKSGGNMV